MEQASQLQLLLQECSSEMGISLNASQIQSFVVYLKQLKVWNESVNLTAITLDEEIIIKHFIDSLAALKSVSLSVGSSLLDIGTGAGFPGIPLKIARPDLEITLIEPSHKRLSFLHFIIGFLRLKGVQVFQGTLDLFMKVPHRPLLYDYITTRAMTPVMIFQHGRKLLADGGKAILYSAKPIRDLYPNANWTFLSEYTFELPNGYGSRTISIFSPSL